MERNFTLLTTTLIGLYTLASCDPGLTGNLKVYNQTDSTITVYAKDYNSNDTFTILPGGNAIVHALGGIGNKNTFECCPCRLDTIYIATASGAVRKDASKKDNWTIPNKGKTKRFGGEDIYCELLITPADVQ